MVWVQSVLPLPSFCRPPLCRHFLNSNSLQNWHNCKLRQGYYDYKKTSFQRPFAIFVVKLSDPTIVSGCTRDPSSCCFQSSVLCWGISCTKCLVCWPTPGNIWRAVRSAVWSSGRLHLAAAASSLVYTTHRSVHLTLLSHSIRSVELRDPSVLLSSGWSWPFSPTQWSGPTRKHLPGAAHLTS